MSNCINATEFVTYTNTNFQNTTQRLAALSLGEHQHYGKYNSKDSVITFFRFFKKFEQKC